ncbi:hypothetical protein B0T19DRAFT_300267 [Cercophora scortea]|uniref:Uncharacterized protein n=1 Tax=Cercophora scortea TaxID=314031 RepID=A0AAE0I3E1_9PEZI|nr:hypothetical protein B0T19DRAFT_300267 [Cercophora scortea]
MRAYIVSLRLGPRTPHTQTRTHLVYIGWDCLPNAKAARTSRKMLPRRDLPVAWMLRRVPAQSSPVQFATAYCGISTCALPAARYREPKGKKETMAGSQRSGGGQQTGSPHATWINQPADPSGILASRSISVAMGGTAGLQTRLRDPSGSHDRARDTERSQLVRCACACGGQGCPAVFPMRHSLSNHFGGLVSSHGIRHPDRGTNTHTHTRQRFVR